MFRLIDTISFTIERILQHRLLVLWVLVGLSIATTLSLSLSLYVDSVYTELLDSRLTNPPYAFRFRYLGAWNGNISQSDVQSASAGIQQQFVETIGLPTKQSTLFVRGGSWGMRGESMPLGTFSVGALTGADVQMNIVAGEWPLTDIDDGEPIPVLLPEALFNKTGLQVGDEFIGQRTGGVSQTFEVAAIWRPANTNDPSWIFTPKFFDEILLVQSDTLWQLLEGIDKPVDESAWFLIFNAEAVRTSDVSRILANIVIGQRNIDTLLPGIRTDLSPSEGLTAFNNEVSQLTQQLFILIAPVGGLVLYFVSLVAGLLVSRQQAEDVKLRSRGMSRVALLTIHIFMWLMLVGMALLIGIFGSPYIVQLVGKTSSFLRFDDPSSVIAVVITPQAIAIGAVTGLISASSGLYMTWRTTGQNINSFQRANVRVSQAWWQRAYLDLMLLIPAGYVLYTLAQQGGLVTNVETPFSDPLTFIGPTLFALGITLLFLRLWPALLSFGASFLSYTRNVSLLMALRELTRSIGRYRGALLMMSFTLSLTGFTASMASTLDRSLEDTINYKVGADVVIITAIDAQTEASQDSSTGQTTYTVTGYNVPPVEGLLEIDGVASVSRVGQYSGRLIAGSQRIDGIILGIDRGALAAVTRFRQDYAGEPLANLMNKLADQRTGVILNRQIAQQYNLIIGQEVTLQVNALNSWYDMRVPIVDFVDYFPTLDPSTGFFVIMNIDPVFEAVGTVLPHDVWLSLLPNAEVEGVRQQVHASGFPVLRWLRPEDALQAARAEPARRGVLGFLSIGFVASITLTLIAAIIQSTASFRAQSTQLGALRAMGLGGLSVGIYVIILQGMVAMSGILSGTSIGVATTMLFLPLLDFSGGLPPYLVRVAWGQIIVVYVVFAAVLFFVTLFTTLVLSRQQVSTIVRLGDI